MIVDFRITENTLWYVFGFIIWRTCVYEGTLNPWLDEPNISTSIVLFHWKHLISFNPSLYLYSMIREKQKMSRMSIGK